MHKHLLLKGDNLSALKHLQTDYKSRVDVIYIDPPYNTRNHKFIYKDKRLDWIAFMRLRLEAACGLLVDDGVIFISIDENESANLKILCDETFGRQNFITQFVWQKKNKPSFLHKKISNMYEFILCYAKDYNQAPLLSVESTTVAKPYPLNFKNNPPSVLCFPPKSVHFHFKDCTVKKKDMSSENIVCSLLDSVAVTNGKNSKSFRLRGSWRYNQKRLDELLTTGCELRVAKKDFRVNLIQKQIKQKPMRNMLTKQSYNTPTYEDAHKEILEVFGFEAFTKAKPSGLIKLLLKSVLHSKKDAIVLDFFAGSGTTAQAVHDFNTEEKKNLQFILVQSEEPIKKNSQAYRHGYTNIYEITKFRVSQACEEFEEIILKRE